MRIRIWLVGVAFLAVCILLLLFRAVEQDKVITNNLQIADTNHPAMPAHREEMQPLAPSVSSTSSDPMPLLPTSVTAEASNALYQRILADWQAPIDFYGKVMDENSNAVGGASVSFRWIETPMELNGRTSSTTSDVQGLFSLLGERGASVEIWVSKEGYYSSQQGHKSFAYAVSGHFRPDPWNPVIFHLRKKGQPEPLVAVKRNYGIPRDGTPFAIDLVNGQAAKGENGNLVVQCWTEDRGKARGQKYDWRCQITVPGGGIFITSEEYAFLAPESGYQPTAVIQMPADRANWKSDFNLKFYYRLADGRYGRMTFSMIAGGQHFCMVDSFLNPSGSRNLEPQ